MGVDLTGIIAHNLNTKEILELPKRIDSWEEIKNIRQTGLKKEWTDEYVSEYYSNFKSARWNCEYEMNEKILELIWKDCDLGTNYSDGKIFDNTIDSYFAIIKVYEKTLLIEQMPWHKYGNLRNSDFAEAILKINRFIAKKLNQNKVLYCVDSGYPTQAINELALQGKIIGDLIKFSELEFGKPPKPIQEGMKFTYFIDNLDEEIEQLKDWEYEEMYWKYDSLSKKYIKKDGI